MVFFELDIEQGEHFEVCPALFKLAVRMKAIYHGLDWSQPFRLSLPKKIRRNIDLEKNKLDSMMQLQIDQQITKIALTINDVNELIQAAREIYQDFEIELPPSGIIEKLVMGGHIDRNQVAEAIKRINNIKPNPLRYNDFDKFLKDERVIDALNNVKINGISEFVQVLGGGGVLRDVEKAIYRHLDGDWLDI